MRPVLTPAEKRRADETAGVPVDVLINRAGAAVARVALKRLGGGYGRTVNVIAGPGANGADGRVAADRLRERGVAVQVFEALDLPDVLPLAELVIDAAFGTGFRDEWRPPAIGNTPVLAVDVPSGVDAATGDAPDWALSADATVTFGALSPGHVLGRGSALVGDVTVADIGLPPGQPTMFVVDGDDVARWLPKRARDAHKWAAAVRVIAGGPGMTGAGHLCSAAALRAGSGMVAVSSPGVDADAPIEAIDRRISPFDWADTVLADLHRYHALVVGPGLGREEYTIPSVVRMVLESVVPIVVDGDGLFALSWNEEGNASFLADCTVPTVLTPHDGEYSQLTGRPPGSDRIAAAHELADLTGATVLLKGPTTVVAAPGGGTLLVTNGSAKLATAGTGDVLAGIVGAFLAQGVPPAFAAAAAAWVHADAAERVRHGLLAGDLLEVIPTVIDSVFEQVS
ncbi:MAG: NAD(P)H-hydrate dehydratase [Ilumatobacteraceae bacterium]